MIACVSPCGVSYEETLNTLKYASRAKNIKKIVNQNIKDIKNQHLTPQLGESTSEYLNIIQNLKFEIDTLKRSLIEKENLLSGNT